MGSVCSQCAPTRLQFAHGSAHRMRLSSAAGRLVLSSCAPPAAWSVGRLVAGRQAKVETPRRRCGRARGRDTAAGPRRGAMTGAGGVWMPLTAADVDFRPLATWRHEWPRPKGATGKDQRRSRRTLPAFLGRTPSTSSTRPPSSQPPPYVRSSLLHLSHPPPIPHLSRLAGAWCWSWRCRRSKSAR